MERNRAAILACFSEICDLRLWTIAAFELELEGLKPEDGLTTGLEIFLSDIVERPWGWGAGASAPSRFITDIGQPPTSQRQEHHSPLTP